MKRLLLVVLAAAVVTVVLLAARARGERRRAADLAAVEAAVEADELDLRLQRFEPETWVRQYRPEASAGGYTLVLYERRVPMIIDMNGRVVHAWPRVRAVGRARLDGAGRLAVIGTDNLIKEYDWEGGLRWYYRLPTPGDFPHHDLIKLVNGNFLVLARDDATTTDYLLEVDSRGRVVWQWRSIEHMDEFPTWDRRRKSPTHVNSVHELPPNRWFAAGDDRFRPGNILVSARHLNTVFIIDKRTGFVVWQYSKGLDYQHEASMVREGDLGSGLILVFDNGRNDRDRYRRSRVLAIDPVADAVEWEYSSPNFYSSVAGTAQKLPGRNVLITSSHGGRAFEVTPEGDIVWEWTPSYMPMRVERLALDHCPQLAELPRRPERPVRIAGDTRPWIDADLYSFALPDDYIVRRTGTSERRMLRHPGECHELVLPPGAMLWAEWGLDEQRLGKRSATARFRLTIEEEGKPIQVLIDSTVGSESDPLWRGRTVPLPGLGGRRVTMCVATEADGVMDDPLKVTGWSNPLITTPAQREAMEISRKPPTEQERRLQEQQLEALGYVN